MSDSYNIRWEFVKSRRKWKPLLSAAAYAILLEIHQELYGLDQSLSG